MLSYKTLLGKRGDLIVSALDSGSSGPGSSPDRGHCVVFLGKTLTVTLTVPLSTQKLMDTDELTGRSENMLGGYL